MNSSRTVVLFAAILAIAVETCAGDYQPPAKDHALAALVTQLDVAARRQPIDASISLGGRKQNVRLLSATVQEVILQVGGNKQTLPLALLTPEDIVALGRASLERQPERALILIDYCLSVQLKRRAEEVLEAAASFDGVAVHAAALDARKAFLGGAADKADTPAAVPTPARLDQKGDVPVVEVTATDDWYCPGYNGAHTYTSKDNLPLPLKLRWSWEMPEGKAHQVLCSGGKVFVKGRHKNTTPIGERVGVHNYVVNLETGKTEAEDPDGTSPNDWCETWAGGTYEGRIYQADDGGPPFCGADVWGPIAIDPAQGAWVVVQHKRIDGPSPGIYCMPLGKGIGQKKWWVGHTITIKETRNYCSGDAAIGAGVVFVAIDWKVSDPALKSGLLCYEIDSGAERWHVAGEYQAVSSGTDVCVAVSKDRVMAGYAAKDGSVLWRVPLAADPECHPMVQGDWIRVYDQTGMLSTYRMREKAGQLSVAPEGAPVRVGRFQGPNVKGCNNSCFCYSADGTLYIANGSTVMGFKPGQKPWQYVPSAQVGKVAAGLGHPIIARGCLMVVGAGGVLCFEHDAK